MITLEYDYNRSIGLTDWHEWKFYGACRSAGNLKILTQIGLGVWRTANLKNPKFFYLSTEKMMKNQGYSLNTRFSLNNRLR